ncbi:Methyltransferase domain-containing protein [Filimonas lacunae]|uniref:Methyltransferase domain-containing protein n=1 Tax=Filimonas lacunae TaxID=477680 RepID=A0A173ME40_9BACT|nr:class I SAM-dependent methyltransferase [Filimonas lacunae]BAV05790.1 methyltransferase [Filimonas lacunae]SIT28622.1 Methyltransferase domain-containing protein [Filimonas lacunae]
MPMKGWYKEWFSSPYYHLLYNNRNDNEALDFIKKLIAHVQPAPGSKMLDVACGRGRHSKILAEMGFDVTGIDISGDSIEVAKESEDEHLHFYQHDMRQPSWINYFDFAFNFFTSFGYFRTRREHDAAFRTIAQSLNANGTFVIDYLNVHYTEDHLVKIENKKIEDTIFHISRWQDTDHFFKQIQIEQNGHLLKHLYTEKVAKFSLGDFTDMLAYQGMQVQEVFGDYQLGHYDVRKSPRMIITATKAKK